MSENYKFFQHKKCEYFPCHANIAEEEFNCIFCYCPLYGFESCGGNNTFKDGIKICTNCTNPHWKKNYDSIINKLIEVNNKNKIPSLTTKKDCDKF